ncbi:MAG: protein-glutamate O-methyltransferase CheR [Anaerolineales bacterium]|nr:protein-glutamate O-methyltransferase CheR [Anaerolineales bacterium]
MKNLNEIENIEIDLLLEAIYQRYGYDFKNYARASIERRARGFLAHSGYSKISELIPRLLHEEYFFEQLVKEFSITVSDMFRDPPVYRAIREKVVPFLKTYPYIKIWHSGCATGQEVYSLAIVLKEEGIYDRATLFATDFNDTALDQAREGIYGLDAVKQFTINYQQAGGTGSFSEYYHAQYDSMIINPALKKNITFANHNLVTDSVFGEMHFILCRNVLIYFNKELKNRVLDLFKESLIYGGFLCLGSKESLMFTSVNNDFITIDESCKIYQLHSSS